MIPSYARPRRWESGLNVEGGDPCPQILTSNTNDDFLLTCSNVPLFVYVSSEADTKPRPPHDSGVRPVSVTIRSRSAFFPVEFTHLTRNVWPSESQ